MRRLTDNKIILVTRPTRVAELKRRFSTRMQAKFYVSHLGQDFSDYEQEDQQYAQAVREAQNILEGIGRVQVVDRAFLPNFVFGPEDVIAVLGQDGLVVNTAKYLNGQPVIGINPDPARWDGQLLPFTVRDLGKVTLEVIRHTRPTKQITMAKATLNTGPVIYAVNDIFIGPRSHGSARYTISIGGKTENHSSSGVIVSTGVGSTGWLKSLLTGAAGIVQSSGTQNVPPTIEEYRNKRPQRGRTQLPTPYPLQPNFPWDADYLCFTVREPFPSKTTQANLVFGRVTAKEPLLLISQMPENGVIFSDGIESDYIEFRSGTRATLSIAEKRGCFVA